MACQAEALAKAGRATGSEIKVRTEAFASARVVSLNRPLVADKVLNDGRRIGIGRRHVRVDLLKTCE